MSLHLRSCQPCLSGSFKAGANVCVFALALLEERWLNSLLPSRGNWGIWYQTVNLSWTTRVMFAQAASCSWTGVLSDSRFSHHCYCSSDCISAFLVAHRSLSCRLMNMSKGWELTCEAPTSWGHCPGCTSSPCNAPILARSSSLQMGPFVMWPKCWSWSAETRVLAGTKPWN